MINNNFCQNDLKTISKNFSTEIEKSFNGDKTSLHFIVHELSPTPLVKEGENFQVLALGGSILRKSLLLKTKGGIKILKIENEKNVFLSNGNNFLNLVLEELYPNIKILALNFAYPLKPFFENGKLDGIFIGSTKGVNLHNLVGKKIGKEIEDYVFKKSKRKIRVAVANDTVCLMLSGLNKFKWNGLAAGIVGTGINFALFINKDRLVNLESACFDKFTQTPEGKIVDWKSDQPGKSLFEKETAGKYLYQHFNNVLKERNIKYSPIDSTKELDSISRKNILEVSEIAQNLLNQSAQLVACQIAGIILFKKISMTFIMEGSLFWKGNKYKENVEKTVKFLAPDYNVKFIEIKNSVIIGTAKLVN